MSTVPLVVPASVGANPVLQLVRELHRRQPTLFLFAAILLVALIPAAVLLGIDARVLRGVNVWVKPMKFMLSIAVFALTTAWFIGYLPAAQRAARGVRAVVAMIVLAGGFEAVYITLQAALGQGSHYNVGDPFHAVMYGLMGAGALVLTASQPLLAWQLHRHRDPSLSGAFRLAVQLGLVLTFVLGAGVGIILSTLQPPTGASLPIVGWSMIGGDLRPAHFVGIHAQQLLPVAGALIVAARPRAGQHWVWIVAALYAAGCMALMIQALLGHPLVSAY
jgi:hypothetical protein